MVWGIAFFCWEWERPPTSWESFEMPFFKKEDLLGMPGF